MFQMQKPLLRRTEGLRACDRGNPTRGIQKRSKALIFQDLICQKCCTVSLDECKVKSHGREYITWKCKFCCSIAVWFCWGNTHFCDPCHRKQIAGEHLNKKGRKDLPVCPGKDKCPLGTEHKPNGEECCIGC
jgi:hypothetical protein